MPFDFNTNDEIRWTRWFHGRHTRQAIVVRMNERLVQIQDENFLRKKIYGGTTSVGIRSFPAGRITYVVDEETGAAADSCSISPIEIE